MIDINKQKIQNLLNRGVENIYPSRVFLETLLSSGKQIRVYLGIDPTGPTLHLGHMIPLQKLKEFQDLGHKIILLIGSFTAMIGDPDKSSVRVPLTKEQVVENMKLYLTQASTLINTVDPNLFEIRYNHEWLEKMNFTDVLSLASKMTVQQMLERDMFDKRIKEGKPVYIHEFMYPLMQGYDSIALDVDGEVGGNDQTFNMLTGRTLMKEMCRKEKFVITSKLLTDTQGVKMGKSEGNMITLLDTPQDMFGKIMSWNDTMIVSGFELCTDVSMMDIEVYKNRLLNPAENPKEIKLQLAVDIVSKYTSSIQAQKAKDIWIQTFEKKEIPSDIIEFPLYQNLMDTVLKNNILSSKSEYRRVLEQGGIHNLTTNETILHIDYIPSLNTVIKIGKQKFFKII